MNGNAVQPYSLFSPSRVTSTLTNTRETTFTYNPRGLLDTVIDPEHFATSYEYDEVGRVKAVHRPDSSTVRFSYDRNGNMTLLVNPATRERRGRCY